MAGGTSLGKLYFELSINDQTSKELEKIKQNIDAALKRGSSGITINEIKLSEGAANKLASEVQSKLNKIEIAVNKTQLQNSVQAALSDFSGHIKVNLIDASFWEDSGNAGKHITVNAKLADGALQQIQAQLDALKGLNINIGATATGVAVSPTATGAASSAAASASEEVKVAETKKEAAQKTAEAVEGKKKAAQKEVEVDKTYQAAIRAGIANLKKLDSAMDSIRLSLAKKGQKVHDELVKFKEERKRIYDEIAKVDGGTAALSTYRQSRLVTGNLTTMKADVAYNAKTAELDTKRFYNLLNARAAAEDMSEAQKQMVARLQAKMFLPAEKLQWQLQNKSSDAAAAGANNAGYEKSIQQIEEFQKRLLNVKSVGEALSMQPVWTQLSSNIAAATSNTDKLNKAFISNQNAVQRLATASERLYGSKIAEGKGGNSAQIAQALNELDKFNAKLKDPNLKQPISELGKEYDALKFKIKEAEVAAASQAAADRKSAAEQKQLLAARTRMYQSINAGIASYTGKKNSTAAGVDTSAYENAIRQLAAFRSQVSGLVDVSNINNVTTAFKNLEATLAADARQMEVLNKEKANIAGMSVSAQALLDKTNANNTGKQLSADMVTALQTLEAFIQKLSTSTSGAAALGQEFNKIKGDIAAASSNTNQQTRQSAQRTKLLEQLESKILSVQKRLYDLDNYSGQKGGYWTKAKNEAEALKRKLEGLRTAQDAAIRSGIGNEYKKANIEIDNYLGKQRAANAAARQAVGSQNQAANSVNRHAKSWLNLNANMSRGGILARMNIDILGQLGNQLAMYLSVYAIERFIKGLADIHGEFQKQKIALGSILGDAAKANELFNQLKSLAVQSPYQFKDLTGFVKQLSAFSFPTDELYDMTKRLADISAGLGVDMGRVILAVGQVRSASYLRGQELRQFTEAGIPLLDELAKKFTELKGRVIDTGDVFDMISKRQVPYEMVRDIMVDLTNEGGKFYKMQEVLADTLAGKISNLTDAYNIMQDEIGKAGAGNFMGWGVDTLKSFMLNWKTFASIIAGIGSAFISAKLISMSFRTSEINGITKQMTAQLRLEQARITEKRLLGQITAAEAIRANMSNNLSNSQLRQAVRERQISEMGLVRLYVQNRLNKSQLQQLLIYSGLDVADARRISSMGRVRLALLALEGSINRVGVKLKNALIGAFKSPIFWVEALTMAIATIITTVVQKRQAIAQFLNEARQKSSEMADGLRTQLNNIGTEQGGVKLDVMLQLDEKSVGRDMKGKILKAVEDMKETIKQYSPIAADQIFDIDSIDGVIDKLHAAREAVADLQAMAAGDSVAAEIVTDYDDVNSKYKKAGKYISSFKKNARSVIENDYSNLPSLLRKSGYGSLARGIENEIYNGGTKEEVITWLAKQITVIANDRKMSLTDIQRNFGSALGPVYDVIEKYIKYDTKINSARGDLQSFADDIKAQARGMGLMDANGNITNLARYKIFASQAWLQYTQKNANLSSNDVVLKDQKQAFEKMMFGFSTDHAKEIIVDYFKTVNDEKEKQLDTKDDDFRKQAKFDISTMIAAPFESTVQSKLGLAQDKTRLWINNYFEALQYETKDEQNNWESKAAKWRKSVIEWFEKSVGPDVVAELRNVAISYNEEFWKQMEMARTKVEFSGWRQKVAEQVSWMLPQYDPYQDLKSASTVDELGQTIQKKLKEVQKTMDDQRPIMVKLGLDVSDFSKYFDENGNVDFEKIPSPIAGNLSLIDEENITDFGTSWRTEKQEKQILAAIHYNEDSNSSSSRSGGSSADKQLQEWKKQFENLKKIYSDYKTWSKDLGREKAIDYLQKSGLTSEDIGDIATFDPNKMGEYVQHLKDRIFKFPMKTEDRKAFKNSVEEFDIQLDVDVDKQALQEALDTIKTEIDKRSGEWDIYKKWFEETGNKKLAMSVAFGGVIEDEDFVSGLKNQLKAEYDKLENKDFTFDELLGKSEKELKAIFGDNSIIVELVKRITTESNKLKKENAENLLEIIKNNKNFTQQLEDIERNRKKDLDIINGDNTLTGEERNQYIEGTNKKYDEKRSKVLFEQFKKDNNWAVVFDDLNRVSRSTLNTMYNSIVDFVNSTDLGVTETKDLISAMKKLREEASERNPFAGFVTALKDIGAASGNIKKLEAILKEMKSGNGSYTMTENIGKLKKGQVVREEDVNNERRNQEDKEQAGLSDLDKSVQDVISKFNSLSQVAGELSKLFDAMGAGSGFGEVTDAAGSAFGAASSTASSAVAIFGEGAGIYGAAAGAAISIATTLFSLHDKALDKAINKSKQRVAELQAAYDELEKSIDRAFGSGSSSVERAIKSYTQLINQVGAMGASVSDSYKVAYKAMQDGGNSYLTSLKKQLRELSYYNYFGKNDWKISITQEAIDAINALGTGTIQNKAADVYRAQYASLVAQRTEVELQMHKEEQKKNSSQDAIDDYAETLSDLNDQITYFVQDLAEELYNINFEDWAGRFSDSLVSAFRNGENAAEAFRETANEILADVANQMVKYNIIEPMFEELEEMLFGTTDANGNRTGGVATMENLFDAPEKVAATIKEWFDSKGNDMLSEVESFLNIFNDATGGSLTDNSANRSGLTASISGITEETADLLASYLNAIRADVSVLRAMQTEFFLKSMPDVTATLGNQLASLKLIEANTLRAANGIDRIAESSSDTYTLLKKATTSGSGVKLNI